MFMEYLFLFTSATAVTTPPPLVCNNGKVCTTWGTACPLTCGNYQDQPFVCTAQCIIGCVCPTGMMKHEDGCVAPSYFPGNISLN